MKFDARELPSYAELIATTDLIVGHPCFFLTFVDDRMFLPELRVVVFGGVDLGGENEGRL